MKSAKKKSILIAVIMIIGGAVVAFSALAIFDFDFKQLSTGDIVTKTYEVKDIFHNINIGESDCDIRLVSAQDGKCRVEYRGNDKESHLVNVENDTLMVSYSDNRNWYDNIVIGYYSAEITVYLPQNEYSILALKTNSGNIDISDEFTFNDMMIETSSGEVNLAASPRKNLTTKTNSGDINLKNVNTQSITVQSNSGEINCDEIGADGNIFAKTESGDMSLNHVESIGLAANSSNGEIHFSEVICEGNIEIKSISGDVKLKKCDAATLSIETSSGNVSGTLLSDKIFTADTGSGNVKLPHTTSGGICEVKTSSGDIKFKIK